MSNNSQRSFTIKILFICYGSELQLFSWEAKSGGSTQKKLRAIFAHCCPHSLPRAVCDMIKEVKKCFDALGKTSEISFF